MVHVWMIALFAALTLHDAAPALSHHGLPAWVVITLSLAPLAVVAVLVHLVMLATGRQLDARGSWRSVALAERTLSLSRPLCVGINAVNVLVLGFGDVVRSFTGDLILVDELLTVLPAITVFALGWWSFYPIDRRLRDASTIRSLDEGRPLYPVPTRWQWVVSNIRHQVLLTLVPLSLIGAWSESLGRLVNYAVTHRRGSGLVARLGAWIDTHESASQAIAGVQLLGAVAVFAAAPLVLRLVWDTARMQESPLRARLMAMCAECGVRVRELLVWRTHGAMVNGAVMGLFGRARYILLTDALLDHLPEREVEAVMAHEVAHARLGHVPWLGATVIATAGAVAAAGAGAGYALERFGLLPHTGNLALAARGGMEVGMTVASLVVSVLMFGFVSRRFEWQADAFAAKHLSRLRPVEGAGAPDLAVAEVPLPRTVSPEAVESMAGALESVARLNHIPRRMRSFRHGSIALRQAKLRALGGRPLARLPIDAESRRLKHLVVCGLLVVAGMVGWEATHTKHQPSAPLRREIERLRQMDINE